MLTGVQVDVGDGTVDMFLNIATAPKIYGTFRIKLLVPSLEYTFLTHVNTATLAEMGYNFNPVRMC